MLLNLVVVQLNSDNFVSFNLQQIWLDPVGEFRRHINLQRNTINIGFVLTADVVVRLFVLLHQLTRTAAIALVRCLFANDQINQHVVIGVSKRDALANRVHVHDVLATRIDHTEFDVISHAASDQRVARNPHQRRRSLRQPLGRFCGIAFMGWDLPKSVFLFDFELLTLHRQFV